MLRVSPASEAATTARRHLRRVGWGIAWLAVYTLAAWLLPWMRIVWFSPTGRVAVEVAVLCVALFGVLALLLPDDGDEPIARNAFIASIVTLGLYNVIFGVGPLLLGGSSAFGGLYSLYPWLAARYLVGVLFIAATLGWPRIQLRWYLLSVVLVLLAVAGVLFLVRDVLPLPFTVLSYTRGGVRVPLSTLVQQAAVAIGPAGLFGLGSWLASRVYLEGASILYLWVAAALGVQAVSKLHEVFYPWVLGPVITSADVLRIVFAGLLLTGAVLKVRQLVRDRGLAVAALEGDLLAHQALLRSLREFAGREHAFRSVVVHELGNPIATLRTFAHVLANSDSAPPRARRIAARGIEAESLRLQDLVDRMDELRDFELEDFACELKPTRLRPLVDDVAAFARGLPGAHPAMIGWSCDDVSVLADRLRLGQALRNIVANAVRYSPERSPIHISCRSVAGDRIEIAISDHGPGIPPDERQRVVRMFERGNAQGREGGTGLGLYIAARVMHAHGGALEIRRDERTRGARLVLELRRA